MFILSVGMPKSGSTLFSSYQKRIIVHTNGKLGQQAFQQLIKDGIIEGNGHFISEFKSFSLLERLVSLSEITGPFVIKSHLPLNTELKDFLYAGKIIATYIHRDPRDVILSAIDSGRKDLLDPKSNKYFCQFDTVENSIPIVREFCKIGLMWLDSGLAEIYHYQDLIIDPQRELRRFGKLINVNLEDKFIDEIVCTFTQNQQKGIRQFNTGKAIRYTSEMNKLEISLCNKELNDMIIAMGYCP